MTDQIDVGEIVRITNGDGFKTKPAGTLFDPIDVELTVRAPDGTVTDISANVLKSGTGLYYADLTVDQAGRWHFRWEGDEVIERSSFWVRENFVGEPE